MLLPISGISNIVFKYDYQISCKLFQPKGKCSSGWTLWNSWHSVILCYRKSTYMQFSTWEVTLKEVWGEKRPVSKGVKYPELCCVPHPQTPTPGILYKQQNSHMEGKRFCVQVESGAREEPDHLNKGQHLAWVSSTRMWNDPTPGLRSRLWGVRQGPSDVPRWGPLAFPPCSLRGQAEVLTIPSGNCSSYKSGPRFLSLCWFSGLRSYPLCLLPPPDTVLRFYTPPACSV